MTRNISMRLGGALLALGLSQSAFASGLSEFQAGQDVYLNAAVVLIDGRSYVTAAQLLPKAAGSLSITLTGRDLGFDTTQSITFRGTQDERNQTITWSVDQTFEPPIQVGASEYLDRVVGQVVTRTWLRSGNALAQCDSPPCTRNTTFELAPGSELTILGHSEAPEGTTVWRKPLRLLDLKGVGGLPQPKLAGMYVDEPDPLCAKANDRTLLTVGAWLTSAVSTGTAVIDFSSSNPSLLSVPNHVTLSAGSQRISVDAIIPAGVSGPVTLSASANGVRERRTVTILPYEHPDCRGTKSPFRVTRYSPELEGSLGAIDLSMWDDGLLSRDRKAYYVNGSNITELATGLGASEVSVKDMADDGTLVGVMKETSLGPWRPFKANPRLNDFSPELLGDFTPTAINNKGTVVGYRQTSAGPVAVSHNGKQLRDIPLSLRALTSEARGVSDTGHVIGTLSDASGTTYGFYHYAGTTVKLPSFTLPVAVNDSGLVAANVTDAAGTSLHPVLISASGTENHLSVPSGYDRLVATSLNTHGWMVATAYSRAGSRGFIYSPQHGLRDLNSLIDSSLGLDVIEALVITDRETVLVRALSASTGSDSLYLLRF